MKFSDLLARIGLAPTSIEQARETRAAASETLAKVNDMFAAAGLNLEQMLEAGPESLKAYLASLDQSEAISELTQKLATAEAGASDLTAQLATERENHRITASALQAHGALLATVGFNPDAKPEEFPAAFKTHVEKAAAAILAKDGRPAVQHVDSSEKPTAAEQLSDAQHLAAYGALPSGSKERAKYGADHYDAIKRAQNPRLAEQRDDDQ